MILKICKILLNVLLLGLPIVLDYLKKKNRVSKEVSDLADSVLEEARKKAVEEATAQIHKK